MWWWSVCGVCGVWWSPAPRNGAARAEAYPRPGWRRIHMHSERHSPHLRLWLVRGAGGGAAGRLYTNCLQAGWCCTCSVLCSSGCTNRGAAGCAARGGLVACCGGQRAAAKPWELGLKFGAEQVVLQPGRWYVSQFHLFWCGVCSLRPGSVQPLLYLFVPALPQLSLGPRPGAVGGCGLGVGGWALGCS